MNKTILLKDGCSVKVISPENAEAYLTETEIEMDYRAKQAVKVAISKAIICKKPIAQYNTESKKAYLQTADNKKITVD